MTIEVGGGGGGLLKPVAFTSAVIASGASGDIVTATAGAGQYFKLTYLMANSATTETGMTLTIDGVDLFSSWTLADFSPNANAGLTTFGICGGYGNTSVQGDANLLTEIYCTSFTVTKVTGTTVQGIAYVYETLEAI